MTDVVSARAPPAAPGRSCEILAAYREAEDLINIGAYQPGSNPAIDLAMKVIDPVNAFLRQDIEERVSFGDTMQRLNELYGRIESCSPSAARRAAPEPQYAAPAAQPAQRVVTRGA